MSEKVEDVNKAAAVIVEFCSQYDYCFDGCPAWGHGPVGNCAFHALPSEWGFLEKREGKANMDPAYYFNKFGCLPEDMSRHEVQEEIDRLRYEIWRDDDGQT